jgi:hypothetical protein
MRTAPRSVKRKSMPPKKVEGYAFSLSRLLTLGVKERFTLREAPHLNFHVHRAFTAVPKDLLRCNFPGLGVMSMVDASELPTIVSLGPAEGYAWQALGPRRPAVVNVEYDGNVPRGTTKGAEYLFILTLLGPFGPPPLRRVK